MIPNEVLQNLSYQSLAERWRNTFWEERNRNIGIFVAENKQGDIVGTAICGPEQSGDPYYQGDIYLLYVLPQNQKQGIGRKLVTACVQHLVQQLGIDTMLIWVIAENPYRRFYESLGGEAVREKTEEIGGKLIAEVGYGWLEIHRLLE
jgi:GNAT superfamily N-acetyltransferase